MTIAFGVLLAGLALLADQSTADTGARGGAASPEAHVERARAAAGETYRNLFTFLCATPGQARGTAPAAPRGRGAAGAQPAAGRAPARGRGPAVPDRSTWYAEPVKVFDNLYFVGQSEYSAWAVTTSDGIILIDTLFDYSVEEEVAGGLRKLGLDPSAIRYAVVTHPHPDHHGGAKFLQERYGTRIVMSAADWDVIDRLGGTKPERDLVAADGQRLTLGETTVTLHITPGHTPGTLSAIVPVRANGTPHVAALWGGTGLNADRASLEAYVQSAGRFDGIARRAGADIILSNHTDWDGSKVYLPQLARGAAGAANPYVVGPASVARYLEVARECAAARLLRLN